MYTPPGELLARTVLNDCRWAVTQYSNQSSGEPLRVGWVAITTLLRAVGHVLSKVDADRDSDVAAEVEEEWRRWAAAKTQHAIFWDFIDAERNDVIKEYQYGFRWTFGGSLQPTGEMRAVVRLDLLGVR